MSDLRIPPDFMNFTARFARTDMGSKVQSFSLAMKRTGAPTADQILDDFIDAWTAAGSINDAQPTPVTAVNLNCFLNVGGVFFSFDRAAPWTAGGGSPDLCSPAVSYTVKKHTAVAGKKFRGRLQLPWAVESEVFESGSLGVSLVSDYNDALEVFRTALAGAASFDSGPYLLHSDATAPTLITSLMLRNTVGTVRKRQPVGTG